jgi:lipopolysaccharide export system permease protein
MAVMLFNPIVAGTSRHYEELVARYSNGESSVLSVSPEGLWLRQGGDGQQIVIRAGRSNDDGTELFDVTFLVFDEAGRPLSRTDASEARLTSGAWALSDVKKWNLGRENPESTATISATSEIRSDLTKDRIRDSFGDPSAVPIWDMPDFISGLDAAGFSARRHKVWLQMELAQPFLMAGMVLLAAGFTMRHSRSGGTGAMVLAAVLSGFTIFFLRNFAQVLGENGQIPVLIAAWFPPLATILLALGMLLHVEDG